MSEKTMKTLEQRLEEIGYREGYFRKQILNTVKEWLQQKREKQEKLKKTHIYFGHRKEKHYAEGKLHLLDEFLEELEKEKRNGTGGTVQ